MNEDIIKDIQKQIIKLLPTNQQDQLDVLLSDSCSEVSRLVAGWIKRLGKSNCIIIIKGTDVCDTKKSHDMLAVTTNDNQVYIIDPTVWQFFPDAESILICISDNINTAFDQVKKIYGGQWSKSEEFIEIDTDKEKEYMDIIRQNIIENSNI